MPKFVVRLKYSASGWRLNEVTGEGYWERPAGWGYMAEDGSCYAEDRHGAHHAHRFASEADAYTYLAGLPNDFFVWTQADEYRIEEAVDTTP